MKEDNDKLNQEIFYNTSRKLDIKDQIELRQMAIDDLKANPSQP